MLSLVDAFSSSKTHVILNNMRQLVQQFSLQSKLVKSILMRVDSLCWEFRSFSRLNRRQLMRDLLFTADAFVLVKVCIKESFLLTPYWSESAESSR